MSPQRPDAAALDALRSLARDLRAIGSEGHMPELGEQLASSLVGEQVARGVEREGFAPKRIDDVAAMREAMHTVARVFAEEGVPAPETLTVLGLIAWTQGAAYSADELAAIVREEA